MLAIVHEEARLRRRDGFEDLNHLLGAIKDNLGDWFLSNASLGIANVRPSVAAEILNNQIPELPDIFFVGDRFSELQNELDGYLIIWD